MRTIVVALAAVACAGSAASLRPPSDEDDPAARAGQVAPALDGYRASYVLLWQGARIGEARETFRADPEAEGGFRFERAERIVVRRGIATAAATTHITVDTDASMIARHMVVERAS